MSERIEFDDVEALLVSWLQAALAAAGDTAKVSTKRLPTTPSRYVRVTRVGGVRNTLVTDQPLVVFECWDATDPTAASLATLTRSIVQACNNERIGQAWLSWSREVSGPAWNPHPDTALPRYQHTQQMTLAGRTVGA